MYHSRTPQHKDVILQSVRDTNGIVRVVFATVALGMGLNLPDVNNVIHYGALEVLKIIFRRVGEEGVVDAVPNQLCIGSHKIALLESLR